VIDRLPPQNLDSEQAVLGSILIDRDAIIEVADFLHAEDFYRQAHGRIFAAMLDLFEHREPIDVVTVAEALERDGELEAVGGPGYLSQLGNDTPTAVHVAQYGRIVERKALLRRLIQAAGRIAAIGYEDGPDIQEAIDRSEAELFSVSQRHSSDSFSALRTLLHDAYDRLDYLHAHRGEIIGIPSGYPDLDLLTTGFQASDLIILAARPSVGKTSLALNIAEHASVREGKTVGLFSLEMSKEQLVLRLLSSVAAIDSQRLRSGFLEEMDFARIAPAMNDLSEASLFIDDTPAISTMELRTKARRLQAERGLDLLIVDYLQLMQATSNSRDANRVQEVSEISRGLKSLARELKVPVIALSQLSRQPELRESAEPRLSDLRESGAIEQDADLVLFLWRDKGDRDRAGQNESDGEIVNLRLAKHRNGPTGEIKLWFKKSQTRFVSYAAERYAEAV
jgi:replicative DNA helicase